MNILIIGSGGREHALAREMAKKQDIDTVYCSPGNAGTALEPKCRNIDLKDFSAMADFAENNNVSLTIPGPEIVLVEGIVDVFQARGLKIFGPDKKAARLEGSKAFAKDFMKKYGVKTASYQRFTSYEEAGRYLDECPFPTVVKADGLAAGKGVIICQNKSEAEEALKQIMIDQQFGSAGSEVVIEEFLEGKEASILSIFDGNNIIPFLSAKDHKKIYEGETGPNTGGMGVVAPNPYVDKNVEKAFLEEILNPTLKGLQNESMNFAGVIFFGLMINDRGVYLLEYNMRFGDPEIQTVCPLLDCELYDMIDKSLSGRLTEQDIRWKNGASCCVVLASGGYPGSYRKGYEITGLDKVENHYYIAGGVMENGVPVTSGGRVLNIVAIGETLEQARIKAYKDIESNITFKDAVYRKDIGL